MYATTPVALVILRATIVHDDAPAGFAWTRTVRLARAPSDEGATD
jgi:hypothetical protein